MGFQEIDYLWESYYSEYREDWEKVRKIAHTTYLSIGVKNPDTAEKFMPFPWDKEKDKSHKVKEANASQEDIKRIKESFK